MPLKSRSPENGNREVMNKLSAENNFLEITNHKWINKFKIGESSLRLALLEFPLDIVKP
jgi:hypothetical protein